LLTKAAERLRSGDYYCRRLGLHLSWVGDLGGWWDEITFNETRNTGFLLGRLDQLWPRVPRTKPLSVGVVLLDLVPAGAHQPDLFDAANQRRQKLSPMIDRINDRYGRCAIGFGLFPTDVGTFEGHAAFHRVPESCGKLGVLTPLLGCVGKRASLPLSRRLTTATNRRKPIK
jgi:DNA polymerase IV